MYCDNDHQIKIIIFNIFIIILIYIFIDVNIINSSEKKYSAKITNKSNNSDKKFVIIKRNCPSCGLFSHFIMNLCCIHNYLVKGYIPIIDLKSYPNVINGFNTSNINYWELFFEQPFGYTLEEVLKKGKNIIYIFCNECQPRLSCRDMPFDAVRNNFWHNFQAKYLPIKQEIIYLADKINRKLFKGSKNVLGVLTRGTDYISKKPMSHPIPPNIRDLINDVKELDKKYIYDYIFFTTEDENIREIFLKSFQNKVKQLKSKIRVNYNYSSNDYLGFNKNLSGNIEYNKIYLINIIILSKCLDIITARCNGSAGIFIITNGFRNEKIYNLGIYN